MYHLYHRGKLLYLFLFSIFSGVHYMFTNNMFNRSSFDWSFLDIIDYYDYNGWWLFVTPLLSFLPSTNDNNIIIFGKSFPLQFYFKQYMLVCACACKFKIFPKVLPAIVSLCLTFNICTSVICSHILHC